MVSESEPHRPFQKCKSPLLFSTCSSITHLCAQHRCAFALRPWVSIWNRNPSCDGATVTPRPSSTLLTHLHGGNTQTPPGRLCKQDLQDTGQPVLLSGPITSHRSLPWALCLTVPSLPGSSQPAGHGQSGAGGRVSTSRYSRATVRGKGPRRRPGPQMHYLAFLAAPSGLRSIFLSSLGFASGFQVLQADDP